MVLLLKKYRMEFLVAILYAFRFVLKIFIDQNGNMDLFFLLAIALLLSKFSYRKIFNGVVLATIVLSIIQGIAIVGAPYQIDYLKGSVFIIKLVLCIAAFLVIRHGHIKFNLRKFLDYVSLLFFLQTVISLVVKTNITWRIFEKRMELFYLEPSELGAFVSILIIIQVYYLREEFIGGKSIFRSVRNLIILGTDVFLTQSASAVIYLIVGLTIVFFYEVLTLKIHASAFIKIVLMVLLALVVGSYLFIGDSYLALRIQGILNGSDSSFNTRITNSFDIVIDYYARYGISGCGLGNQVSNYGMNFFNLKAVNYSTCSAIATFALEGGILAIFVMIIFIVYCVKRLIKYKDGARLRWALFSFAILYVFGGGYLTNPVLWIIVGFAVTKESYYYNQYQQVTITQ